MRAKTVAVMQPYFFPYLGYFRLFAAVDEFVIFDTVQFPRRGRVHRSHVGGPTQAPEWLTLPLAYCPADTLIQDLLFAPDARASFDGRLARLPWIATAKGPLAQEIRRFLALPLASVNDCLEAGLRLVADIVDVDVTIVRASSLDVDPSLRGQASVLAIAKARGATRYVNPPGGRALYSASAFEESGIELSFLTPYEGRFQHLLPALMEESAQAIRHDLIESMALAGA